MSAIGTKSNTEQVSYFQGGISKEFRGMLRMLTANGQVTILHQHCTAFRVWRRPVWVWGLH